jgi:hypothetical protein
VARFQDENRSKGKGSGCWSKGSGTGGRFALLEYDLTNKSLGTIEWE